MMANDHGTVLATMIFNLVAPAGVIAPVGVELRYDSRNPYEIAMKLNVGADGQVDWVIARDLLADGLIAEAGEGDVRIRPRLDSSGVVVIELSSPSGQASFEVDADQLVDFVNDTYDVVAPGDEHRWMNVDEVLSRLLSHNL
ncbi:SsgA family sporulation/cell division regulator [Saccharopolyspora spinosa]|uniref:Sporulation and cell division protein SsgA n=1 Tax=Saccharopolyspora spinosa TaxID=60894 RepID=A0A2N3Y128_SACSN|nr:SsgA family sporulation/cell division regulator [Saccharopolyspora spinosa]PKW16617.1 sporulation and cell division protein SsgA [Saccharopolyspora spinosa]PKW16694.1 sporulation and cell division protein SsgA [Saccharopolyspora spinosa]